jgi:hypothetical protein
MRLLVQRCSSLSQLWCRMWDHETESHIFDAMSRLRLRCKLLSQGLPQVRRIRPSNTAMDVRRCNRYRDRWNVRTLVVVILSRFQFATFQKGRIEDELKGRKNRVSAGNSTNVGCAMCHRVVVVAKSDGCPLAISASVMHFPRRRVLLGRGMVGEVYPGRRRGSWNSPRLALGYCLKPLRGTLHPKCAKTLLERG